MRSPTRLDAYLAETNTSNATFAAKIGVHETAVMRWRRGEREPRRKWAVLIEKLTGGRVSVESWETAAAETRPAAVRRSRRRSPRKTPKGTRHHHPDPDHAPSITDSARAEQGRRASHWARHV